MRHPTVTHIVPPPLVTKARGARSPIVAIASAVLLAACAGAPGATSAPDARATGASSGPGASAAAGAGTVPAATSAAGGGGGTVGAACDLLTDAQIKAVTGFPVASEKAGPQMGIYENGCDWEIASDGIVPAEIILGVRDTGGRSYYDTFFGPYEEGPAIAGLGDVAVEGVAGTAIAVRGDVLISLQYVVFPTDMAMTKKLAQAVFDTIGG